MITIPFRTRAVRPAVWDLTPGCRIGRDCDWGIDDTKLYGTVRFCFQVGATDYVQVLWDGMEYHFDYPIKFLVDNGLRLLPFGL